MDGLTSLQYIINENICPVVMFSSLTQEGALVTFEALELGAFDFVAKPGGTISINIDAVKNAVASRKQELTKSVKYDNIKVGDVLVFGDNKYGLVEKVTTTKLTVVPLYGERLTPAKDANKRVTVLKKDFSKMVQSVYDTKANVVLGTNDVPSPTAEEKDLINKNVDLQNDFLTDKKAREIARLKDADRSANDVSDEFLNKLGC
jgi:hypothetical protein